MKIVAFAGRIDRSTFFFLTLLLYVFAFVFGLMLVVGGLTVATDLPSKDVPAGLREMKMAAPLAWTFVVVGLVGGLATILGIIGTSVRRLHDFGFTGFLVLLYLVLKHVIPDTGWPDWLPGPADLLWFLIMIAQPGTRGPNAFGPDPRGLDARAPDPRAPAASAEESATN